MPFVHNGLTQEERSCAEKEIAFIKEDLHEELIRRSHAQDPLWQRVLSNVWLYAMLLWTFIVTSGRNVKETVGGWLDRFRRPNEFTYHSGSMDMPCRSRLFLEEGRHSAVTCNKRALAVLLPITVNLYLVAPPEVLAIYLIAVYFLFGEQIERLLKEKLARLCWRYERIDRIVYGALRGMHAADKWLQTMINDRRDTRRLTVYMPPCHKMTRPIMCLVEFAIVLTLTALLITVPHPEVAISIAALALFVAMSRDKYALSKMHMSIEYRVTTALHSIDKQNVHSGIQKFTYT